MCSENLDATTFPHQIRKKIWLVATTLQLVGVAYVTWIFWLILAPLRDSNKLVNWLNIAWHSKFDNFQPWQFGVYFVIDLFNWILLVTALVYCWRSLNMIKNKTIERNDCKITTSLINGAWFGFFSIIFSILDRPLKSYIMTCCEQSRESVIHWFIAPQDLLGVMFCVLILAFAYIFKWTAFLSEENKGFI